MIDRRRSSPGKLVFIVVRILVGADAAHAMSGLAGLAGLAVLYVGVIMTVALVVASALAGWRYVPWGIGCAVVTVLYLQQGLEGEGSLVGGVIVPSIATCVFLVLAYRRQGSFVCRVTGTMLVRPAAFRDVAESPCLRQASIAFALVTLAGFRTLYRPAFTAAYVGLGAVCWLLLVPIVSAIARAVPPGQVDRSRVARCLLFAAVPTAIFGSVLALVYGAVGVRPAGYASYMLLYFVPSCVWTLIVFFVALRAALERDRVTTIGIAVAATLLLALSTWPRGQLLQKLVQAPAPVQVASGSQ